MDPLIIEVALNGTSSKARNPNVPGSPAEVAADALACLEAGASVIHTHVSNYRLEGPAATPEYIQGWAPVLAAHPDAIVYGTAVPAQAFESRFGHYRALAAAGMRMGVIDPGSVNLPVATEGGLPKPVPNVYRNSHEDIAALMALLDASRLGPSLAIYEPGFLRTALGYERAGRMPAGAFVKLYFAGDYSFLDGARTSFTFGLPPTRVALDAYREMMQGSALPWAVAVLGGCVATSGMARLAIERGGHVRVGLEDFAGERQPGNAELVAEVAAIAAAAGRPVATSAQAARILRLPASD